MSFCYVKIRVPILLEIIRMYFFIWKYISIACVYKWMGYAYTLLRICTAISHFHWHMVCQMHLGHDFVIFNMLGDNLVISVSLWETRVGDFSFNGSSINHSKHCYLIHFWKHSCSCGLFVWHTGPRWTNVRMVLAMFSMNIPCTIFSNL